MKYNRTQLLEDIRTLQHQMRIHPYRPIHELRYLLSNIVDFATQADSRFNEALDLDAIFYTPAAGDARIADQGIGFGHSDDALKQAIDALTRAREYQGKKEA